MHKGRIVVDGIELNNDVKNIAIYTPNIHRRDAETQRRRENKGVKTTKDTKDTKIHFTVLISLVIGTLRLCVSAVIFS